MLRKIFLLAALTATGPVLACDYQVGGLKPDVRIRVENLAGSIQVQGWDKPEICRRQMLGEGVKSILTRASDSEVVMELEVPKGQRDVGETEIRLKVPFGARLDLNGVSTDIVVQDVRGDLRVQSVSGDISLRVESPVIEAKTVSGDLALHAPQARQTRLGSVSGDVQVSGARELLSVETVSGSVDVNATGLRELEVKSVSGDFQGAVDLLPGAKLSASSMSGEIRLDLGGKPDGQLSLRTFSGDLQSDFGAVPEGKKRQELSLGSGKGRIDLNSFSGDIELRKR